MRKKIKSFLRSEVVLVISFAAALISSFFIPPDAQWLSYFDWRTLALLYCLMTVVAGYRRAGTFARLAHVLCLKANSSRTLAFILIALSFFSSMFITNDVALLTFVPFAVAVMGMAKEEKQLTVVVVLQAIAANLGSMLLPVGNPQNLYIHSHYGLSLPQFLSITFPVWAVSLLMIAALIFTIPNQKIDLFLGEQPILNKRSVGVYSILFLVCLLVVFRILTWPVMLGIIIFALFFYDRRILLKADFMLLLTFVCFFIFAGNLSRIEIIHAWLQDLLVGREFWCTLISSQIISNVPATLLLSGFTENFRGILLGADIGGLGTPIASLASLIAFRLYSHAESAKPGKFMVLFTVLNLLILVILVLIFH